MALMRKFSKGIQGLALSFFLSFCSCSSSRPVSTDEKAVANGDLTQLKFSVQDAPEWTRLFFRSSGWFGGDGIFALPQNGEDKFSRRTKVLLLFSDTMIGDIENGELKPGYVMIHNSVATLSKPEPAEKNIKFYWDTFNQLPHPLFVPNTPATRPGDYYWLGDGFVNQEKGDNTYIIGYRIRDVNAEKAFGFQHVGSTLIILPKGSLPPYKSQRQMDIPFFMMGKDMDETMAFGSGIFVNTAKAGITHPDGYVYVYGVRGKNKSLVAARVQPKEFERFEQWRFWNGSDWVKDMKEAANITDRVSNELSVTELEDGRYALIFQVDGISPIIGLRLGKTPVGPFGPIIKVFDCKEALTAKNIFPYNAKAHPSLSKKGELLVSYNVNSFDFFNDIKRFPNLYRPRFIKIKFN